VTLPELIDTCLNSLSNTEKRTVRVADNASFDVRISECTQIVYSTMHKFSGEMHMRTLAAKRR
jgi:hypothetical protein